MAWILMADIIDSSRHSAKGLMTEFRKVVEKMNETHRKGIDSPLTITLGDEFQGVIKKLPVALDIVFGIEEQLLKSKNQFKLRFVINEGDIKTSINKKKAHEMLGPGLTMAREMIEALKSEKQRFKVNIVDPKKNERLNLAFEVYQGLVDQWTTPQRKVASVFLELDDYRKVAQKLKKDASVIWRRRQSLMIDEYYSMKKLIHLIAG